MVYFQQVRGQQAFAAGLLIAAQGVGVLASRGIAGQLTDRIGARWVAFTGLVVVALATVPFCPGHRWHPRMVACCDVGRTGHRARCGDHSRHGQRLYRTRPKGSATREHDHA